MNLPKRTLAGGELAPALHARTDTLKYATGVRTMRNFQIMRHGGAQTRPGMQFIARTKHPNKKARLIPFVFGIGDSAVIEMGDKYFRVHAPGQTTPDPLASPAQITAVSVASQAVITAEASPGGGPHGLQNGQEVDVFIFGPSFSFVGAMEVASATTSTLKLKYIEGPKAGQFLNTSGENTTGCIGSIAKRPMGLTPYLEEELFDLQFVQSGDKITITHPMHPPMELMRKTPTSWALESVSFVPKIKSPTGVSTGGSVPSDQRNVRQLLVTAIDAQTFEESLPSAVVTSTATQDKVSWGAVAGAREYNVYVYHYSFGLVAVVSSSTTYQWFADVFVQPDVSNTPPIARNPFASAGQYPAAVSYVQQRLAMGGSKYQPETVYLSRTGRFTNFTISSPMRDDDAITFTIAGRQLNDVRHLLDLGGLVILTGSGEFVAKGGGGVLTPTSINLEQQSYYGSAWVRPVVIGKECIFVQARKSAIRSFGYSFESGGYTGNDLTVFSGHLFDNYDMVEMAFQQTPHSILWVVRSDGKLLGMTYIKEHEIFGWHRHDTDGDFESVCSIPHDDRDAVYAVVKRKVNGQTVRYIELMADRNEESIREFVGMDAAISIPVVGGDSSSAIFEGAELGIIGDGSNPKLATIHVATGLPLGPFTPDYAHDEIHVVAHDGSILRFSQLVFIDDTHIEGTADRAVPAEMRTGQHPWTRAIKKVTGLTHLEGKAVSVLADGHVVASPNHPKLTKAVVTGGEITLDRHYSQITVGLPFVADLETLDIDQAQGQSIVDKKKLIQKVTMLVETSRGMWVGPDFPAPTRWRAEKDGFWVGAGLPDSTGMVKGMTEMRLKDQEGFEDPERLTTGNVEVLFEGHWNSHGRVAIRHVDPTPLSVLSIIPHGIVSGAR